MASTILNALLVLSHLAITPHLKLDYYHQHHVIDEETETNMGPVACPRPHSRWHSQDANSDSLAPEHAFNYYAMMGVSERWLRGRERG